MIQKSWQKKCVQNACDVIITSLIFKCFVKFLIRKFFSLWTQKFEKFWTTKWTATYISTKPKFWGKILKFFKTRLAKTGFNDFAGWFQIDVLYKGNKSFKEKQNTVVYKWMDWRTVGLRRSKLGQFFWDSRNL